MKKSLGLVISLSVIAGACAAVLAFVNQITAEPIKATARANEMAAVKAVMPAGVVTMEAMSAQGGDCFVGRDDKGQAVGYAAKGADGGGYGGDIVLMVGFKADRKTVVCYRTLVATETPGLGMKLKTPEFSAQFAGKDGAALAVRKDGGEIEAITSATITSRAVCRAIAHAQKKLARAPRLSAGDSHPKTPQEGR